MPQYIYLFRHGQTASNLIPNKKMLSDEPLNCVGQQQAKAIGHAMQKEHNKPQVIFSSELLRAKQTADIVGKIAQIPIETNPLLNEFNFGVYIGQTLNNADIYKDLNTREEKFYFRLSHGESDADVAERVERFTHFVRTLRYPVGICTHNYPAFLLKEMLLGKSINELVEIPFSSLKQGIYIKFEHTSDFYKITHT